MIYTGNAQGLGIKHLNIKIRHHYYYLFN